MKLTVRMKKYGKLFIAYLVMMKFLLVSIWEIRGVREGGRYSLSG